VELQHVVPPPGTGKWKKVSRQIYLLRKIVGYLKAARPDVVHQQVFGSSFCILVGIACRMLKIPSVVQVTAERHAEVLNNKRLVALPDDRKPKPSLRGALLEKRDHFCLRLFDQIWVTTPTFREKLKITFGLSQDRMVLYPCFISLDRFQRANAKTTTSEKADKASLRIVTVCRLKPWKGIEDCLAAAAQLPADFHWRIIGSGDEDYEKELKQTAASLGLEGKVEFLGAIPPDAVRAEYAESDLFVLGSRYEPFGIVLIEAMSMGLPIVATTAGGIPDVLEHEKTGLLVPPGRPELLGAAIAQLLRDPQRREQLATAGLERSLDFGPDRGAEFFLQLYSRMTSTRPIYASEA
jgi:glycosyltransferase involved in cell wall biosynthesis